MTAVWNLLTSNQKASVKALIHKTKDGE